jgi:hypothetical protein
MSVGRSKRNGVNNESLKRVGWGAVPGSTNLCEECGSFGKIFSFEE